MARGICHVCSLLRRVRMESRRRMKPRGQLNSACPACAAMGLAMLSAPMFEGFIGFVREDGEPLTPSRSATSWKSRRLSMPTGFSLVLSPYKSLSSSSRAIRSAPASAVA